MKQKLTLLILALITTMGAWAIDVTVLPANGVYWKNGAATTDAWAPIWKSNAKASDMTTPMLVLTGETGMNTANGDIYSNQTYTLEAPSGYTIVSYSFNGTATDGDVTITPAGGSGTLISSGSSLGSPLSVAVGAQSTTFALSGSGHIASLALTVKVEHYIVTYSTSTGSYTTTDGFVHEWNSTATDPQVTFAVSGGANNIAKSTGYIYSGSGGCTYVLTAQGGYLITGYEIVGTAQTAAQTLTPAAGGSATTFATSGTTTLTVTGLSTQSTTFTQSTPNNGIAISSFKIYLEKDPCTATYVISDASGVIYTSEPFAATAGETITTLPSSLQRPYCTYSVTSTTIATGENTVSVTVTYAPPFTVSSDFASATWYYATLRGKQLRADESHKDGSGRYQTNSTNERTDVYKWAFVGNPYNLSIINKEAGSSKVLYAGSVPVMQAATPASDNKARWIVSANSTGGFSVRSESGANLYINDAGNGGNLGYWNSTAGANDGGSNWLVSEVTASDKAALADAITSAQALVAGAGVPGYINSTAAATLSSAISTAQSVYDDPSGDYASAYNTLAAAIATASVPANINYTPRTDVYYTIVNARGAMVYDPSHSASVDTQNDNSEYIWYGSTTPDATNPNNLWGFIEENGNYYMYNVGKRQFASVGHGTYGNTWIFSNTPAYITLDDGIADEIVPPGVRVRATIATTGNSYTMSVSKSYTGPVITYDANGDGGVPMVFAESSYAVNSEVTAAIEALLEDPTPYRNALKDLIDGCAAISLGSGLNQYASNSTYTDALAAANTAYNNNSATISDLQTAKQDLEDAIAGLTLNLPASNKFYRIQGNISGKYLAAGMANNKYAMSDATDATTIFYYGGTKLTNLSSGMCNGVSSGSWNWVVGADASTVTFYDGHTSGGYGIQTSNVYFYDNGSNADRGQDVNMETGNTRYRSWYLTEITTLPVTVSDAGYATLYAPVALTIPSDVKAYYISSLTTTEATLTEISTTIPAATPVVLQAEEGTYDFAITSADAFSGTNYLEGQTTAFSVSADDVANKAYYTLQRNAADNTIVGFYPKTAAGSIAGFKAYLPSSAFGGGEVKGFTFIFEDDATGIVSTLRATEEGAIYNLAGQRLNKKQKGINIVNGRKVLY